MWEKYKFNYHLEVGTGPSPCVSLQKKKIHLVYKTIFLILFSQFAQSLSKTLSYLPTPTSPQFQKHHWWPWKFSEMAWAFPDLVRSIANFFLYFSLISSTLSIWYSYCNNLSTPLLPTINGSYTLTDRVNKKNNYHNHTWNLMLGVVVQTL